MSTAITGEPGTFAGELDAATRVEFDRLGRPRKFRHDAVLFYRHDQSTHVFVVVAGAASIIDRPPRTREVTLVSWRDPGEIIGDDSVLSTPSTPSVAGAGWPRPAPRAPVMTDSPQSHEPRSDEASVPRTMPHTVMARAIGELEVRAIETPRFIEFLNTHPQAWAALARNLQRRLVETQGRLVAATHGNQHHLIARILLERSTWAFTPERGEHHVVRCTQSTLATWAGCSERTIERAFDNWRRNNIIATGRGQIGLLDLTYLSRLARRHDRIPIAPSAQRWSA